MTKEEEAIENLTKLLKQRNEKEVKITTFDLFENIETVLNMLKEKDKLYHKALADLVKADRKNIENEMVIDLMAETIRKLAISLASYKGSYNKETINFTGNIKGIKQYFERKVENGN